MPTSKHGTLTPNQVHDVTIDYARAFEIINRSRGETEIWVRFDAEEPVPEADGTYVVIGSRRFTSFARRADITVRMKSTAAVRYSVEPA